MADKAIKAAIMAATVLAVIYAARQFAPTRDLVNKALGITSTAV